MVGRNSRPGPLPAVNYSLKCRDCRYARNFGNAPVTCSTKVSVHTIRQHHTVDWFINGKRQETVNPNDSQLALDDGL